MAQQGPRISGKIIKIVADKGFGFIADDHGTEYFFHRSAIHRSAIHEGWNGLQPQQHVTFIVDDTNPKGPRAEQIELTD